MKLFYILPILAFITLLSSCTNTSIKSFLKKNPKIIAEIIEENPELIIGALNKASVKMRQKQALSEAKKRISRLDNEFKNPKKPVISRARAVFGNKKAPITIVKFSDFMCGFCKKSAGTIEKVLKTYKNKVRVVYKHLPLDFHKQAYLSAQYYEAVVKEKRSKAKSFYEKLFANQSKLGRGAELLDTLVKEVGLKPARVKRHFKSVRKIIDQDIKEASKFGFNGTPAFLIGGVSLSGAQPFSEFKKIIDRHIKNMKL